MTIDLTNAIIIEDLQTIEPKLTEHQKKYKLLLHYFYKIYRLGKIKSYKA